MAWDDEGWLKNGLPVFSGGKDKTLARKLIGHLGGAEGFRKVERTLPDGLHVIVTLRGDMPPAVRFYDTPQVVIPPAVDYIEENYLLRTADYPTKYALGTDRIGWLINTPFLNGGSFNPYLVMPSGTAYTWRDEYFYPPEAYKFSTDGLYTLTCARKIKQARLSTLPVVGTILAAVAYDVQASHYSDLHTIVSSLIYRVNPVHRVPVTIDAAVKVIEFKPPPAQIVFPNTVGEGVNPFDDIEVFGNAWHGKQTPSGLLTPDGFLQTKILFNPATTPLYHYTYYLHFEGLPEPPAPTEKESAIGMKWYRDVVMYGWARKTLFDTSGFGRKWLYRDDGGVVHHLVVTVSVDENLVLRATVKEAIRFIDGTQQTYTHVSDAECVNYVEHYTAQSSVFYALRSAAPALTGGTYQVNIANSGEEVPHLINLKSDIFFSPNGKKCCIVHGAADGTQGYLRGAIEFEASGGTGELGLEGLISVSWRAVTEIRDEFVFQVAHSGFNEFTPARVVTALPDLGGYSPYGHNEWATFYRRKPASIGYTKTNTLHVDTEEAWSTSYSYAASELVMPFLGEHRYRKFIKTQLNHALGSLVLFEEDDEVWTHVRYQLTTAGNLSFPSTSGYYLYENLPQAQTTVSADPFFADGTYGSGVGDPRTVIREIPPNNASPPYTVYEKHTDTLLIVYSALPPTYQYVITEAIAYGERVSALIGAPYTPGSTKISYNPRTGEVSIDEQATFT